MSDLMQAMLLTGFGGPEKLIYSQVPKPNPQTGEVLVKVGACSVNNTDLNTRSGWYGAEEDFQALLQDTITGTAKKTAGWYMKPNDFSFPRIQGTDIVGQVVMLGPHVTETLKQQRVLVDSWIRSESRDDQYLGSELDGGFAEYVVVPASNVHPIRSSLSDVELATFPCAYSTAENMLSKGRVSAKDTVLIMGASGGVGSALIQLSQLRGATTIAIVGANKESFAQALGADYVYRRDEQLASNLEGHQITVCLDVVGGAFFEMIINALSIHARYVTAGAIAGPRVILDLRHLIYKDLELIGATRTDPAVFQQLITYLEQDRLRPLVAKVFPLAELKAAQQFFQAKGFFGKVVITPT